MSASHQNQTRPTEQQDCPTTPHRPVPAGTGRPGLLIPDSNPEAAVEGTVLTLTTDQLAQADAYEVDAYHRVEVALRSGRTAWVYALR